MPPKPSNQATNPVDQITTATSSLTLSEAPPTASEPIQSTAQRSPKTEPESQKQADQSHKEADSSNAKKQDIEGSESDHEDQIESETAADAEGQIESEDESTHTTETLDAASTKSAHELAKQKQIEEEIKASIDRMEWLDMNPTDENVFTEANPMGVMQPVALGCDFVHMGKDYRPQVHRLRIAWSERNKGAHGWAMQQSGCHELRVYEASNAEQCNHYINILCEDLLREQVEMGDGFPLVVGFDAEWKPSFRRGVQNPVSLLQISSTNVCVLVRMLSVRNRSTELNSLLANPAVYKVGVGSPNDSQLVTRHYNIEIKSTLDTLLIARSLYGPKHPPSLQKLTFFSTGMFIKKVKKVTMSNWEAKILRPEQKKYGAMDAFVSREGFFGMYVRFFQESTETDINITDWIVTNHVVPVRVKKERSRGYRPRYRKNEAKENTSEGTPQAPNDTTSHIST